MPAFCGEMYVENDFLYRVEARILEKNGVENTNALLTFV